MKKYKPIDCSLYDYYELLIREKQHVLIKTETLEVEATILNVYTKNHIEYIDLDNGTTLRLDVVKKINDLKTDEINQCKI